MLQSMPDASPVKWHLAHTTWFFETFLLLPNLPAYRPFDSRFQYLFNSYYKQLGGHPVRARRGLMSRPSLPEVLAYREHIDSIMLEYLESAPEEQLALAELGLNHEQQHQELIVTDIKHGLWSGALGPQNLPDRVTNKSEVQSEWLDFEGGTCEVGYAGQGFAFDNESPRHEVLLQPFRIASRPVTNSEYLEFIADNGYRRPELWLSEGWDTLNAQTWNAPLYWHQSEDGEWWQFVRTPNQLGLKRVNQAEPVCHISFFEADAYARWRGLRLPTEEEWEVASARVSSRGAMLDDMLWHPQPAPSPQMFGDVWQWTASAYLAYPGFKPAAGVVGEYNGKFMCNQFVLRGGSCATPVDHIRPTYRNFFPPHARWQFSGLRLAQ
jgi:ergothioneine biosynthesis protein EgtB